jgi:hypothetical protein
MLRARDMRASADREEFFQFQHGDGRLKLIKRLAAADRAGELPRLHARVRRLTQDAGDASHLLSHRTFRLEPLALPKTHPQLATTDSSLRRPSWRRPIQAVSAHTLRAGAIEALWFRDELDRV